MRPELFCYVDYISPAEREFIITLKKIVFTLIELVALESLSLDRPARCSARVSEALLRLLPTSC